MHGIRFSNHLNGALRIERLNNLFDEKRNILSEMRCIMRDKETVSSSSKCLAGLLQNKGIINERAGERAREICRTGDAHPISSLTKPLFCYDTSGGYICHFNILYINAS